MMQAPAPTAPANAASLSAWIDGVGLLAPGLESWEQARGMWRAQQAYASAPTVLPAPDALPAAERRRASRVIKLALAVAHGAMSQAQIQGAQLASVFTSSTGDGHNCHALCETLASSDRSISPTRFHNSVHNTAAGYWCIAAQATGPCQVLAAYDASACAGLLEALTQVQVEQRSVLLVAYDSDYPEPLHATRPVPDAAGVALVLQPQRTAQSLAHIGLEWPASSAAPDALPDAALDALRCVIPALRLLPLLRLLALQQASSVYLDYLPGSSLCVQVRPC